MTGLLVLLLSAAPDAGWSGVSGGVEVSWTRRELVARADGGVSFVDTLGRREPGCEAGSFGSEARSLVGPMLSWFRVDSVDCGGAHPSCSAKALTVDLRTGKSVDLFELFGRAQVMSALRKDSFIRSALSTDGGTREVKTFKALQHELLMSRQLWLSREAFYFHRFERGRIAVRVVLVSTAHAVCGETTELGLWFDIPEALREPLERAVLGAGFLADRRPRDAKWGQ